MPDPAAGPIRAGFCGELGAIPAIAESQERASGGDVRFSVVAGARNHLYLLITATGIPRVA